MNIRKACRQGNIGKGGMASFDAVLGGIKPFVEDVLVGAFSDDGLEKAVKMVFRQPNFLGDVGNFQSLPKIAVHKLLAEVHFPNQFLFCGLADARNGL